MNKEEHKDEEKAKQEAMKEACPQTGKDDAMCHQPTPFDWVTDIDQSIGPVPSASNFRPTTPAPKKPIASMPASPNLAPPKPTVTLSSGDVALHAPTLASSKDPTTLLNCAPIECVDSLPPVSHLPACVTTNNTAPAVGVNPVTTHAPHNLSALQSGTRNPWGSLSRRRYYSHPSRDFSSLHSGTSNPWGSLRHRNRRSYPPHPHHVYSHPESPQYSYPNPSQIPLRKPQSHSQPPPHPHPAPSPVHIFQTIQHLHGISPTKPEITKTIPITTMKITKNTHTACCACGNTIPVYSPD